MSSNNFSVILTYFPGRGKAEIIRLLLNDQQVQYEENSVDFMAWGQGDIKSSLYLPFGQLPYVIVKDGETEFKMAQTQAIMRYFARKLNIYGKTEQDRIRCDQIQEAFVDGYNEVAQKYVFNKDYLANKEQVLKEFAARLKNLENFYIEGQDYWVGDSVSYVDYQMWVYLDNVRAGCQNSLELLQQFPKIFKFYTSFPENRKNIKEYLASSRRYKNMGPPMAPFGNTPEAS